MKDIKNIFRLKKEMLETFLSMMKKITTKQEDQVIFVGTITLNMKIMVIEIKA